MGSSSSAEAGWAEEWFREPGSLDKFEQWIKKKGNALWANPYGAHDADWRAMAHPARAP
jgi:hypothetical protein